MTADEKRSVARMEPRRELCSREFRLRDKYLREQNRKWPLHMTLISPDEVNLAAQSGLLAVFRSSKFLAQLFVAKDDAQRLSICRTEITITGDWKADISWDDLQLIKAECGFGDRWAVEIFPPDPAVVNIANMRHLWLTLQPQFAWMQKEKP